MIYQTVRRHYCMDIQTSTQTPAESAGVSRTVQMTPRTTCWGSGKSSVRMIALVHTSHQLCSNSKNKMTCFDIGLRPKTRILLDSTRMENPCTRNRCAMMTMTKTKTRTRKTMTKTMRRKKTKMAMQTEETITETTT